MKVLAVDYGERKIGLAVSDETGVVTAKLPVLFAKKEKNKIEGIQQILAELGAQIVLFGVPKLNSEFENEQEKEIKKFAEKLKGVIDKNIVIRFWDESFSSQNAEKGKSKKYINEKSDSEAARLFLQEFLDSPDGLNQVSKNN